MLDLNSLWNTCRDEFLNSSSEDGWGILIRYLSSIVKYNHAVGGRLRRLIDHFYRSKRFSDKRKKELAGLSNIKLFARTPIKEGAITYQIFANEIEFIHKLMRTRGFVSVNTHEVVSQRHNFDFLNIAAEHPCRKEHDSMILNREYMLTSQLTSSHFSMKLYEHPGEMLYLVGRAYREDQDATHLPCFWQLEWLIKSDWSRERFVSMIEGFLYAYLGRDIIITVRPSYFPFTYQSFEIDIQVEGKTYEVCGAGFMHPEVLRRAGVASPERRTYPALAFGIERLIMIKYRLSNIKEVYKHLKWY